MIKVSYDELGKQVTQQAMMKLSESEFRDMEGYRAKQIAKAAREAFFKMRDSYKSEIQDKYAQKDEDGRVGPAISGKAAELKLPFQCKDDVAEAAKAALDAFGKTAVEIKFKKLSLEGLFKVNSWTPAELEGLEHFYEEPTEHQIINATPADASNVKPMRPM